MPKDQYLLQALEFIDDHITQELSLYEIASVAGFSVPHFYRLFKQLTGDTVGAYVLRRRILLAARDLTGTNKTVSSIAYEYGFDSHDVFTRAFKRVFGVSPASYRRGNTPPPLKSIAVITQDAALHPERMAFSLVHAQSFFVMGIERQAQRWDQGGAIGRLWSDFLPRAAEIKQAAVPMVMYGICEHETCRGASFTYLAGIGASAGARPPAGMLLREMPAQTFFQVVVPEQISVPDAYTGAAGYARSLGYDLLEGDTVEVYEETFRDPAFFRMSLNTSTRRRRLTWPTCWIRRSSWIPAASPSLAIRATG